MTDAKNLTPPTSVKTSPLIKKIPTIQLATDPNAIASNFIPTSLLASTGTVMPLSLISNPYLTGQANNQPSFSQLLSMGLVSSAKAVSEDWITVSGQSVTFNYPSYLVFDNDFYQMPPCSLSVSSTNVVSVLYVAKSKSGMSPLESQIGLIQTKQDITASEALSYADSQITSVYMPLAVLSGDENGNQTLMWELDQNSQFSAPVLNQFVLLQDFEANAKQFLTNQFTALYNDLVQFATWQKAWDEIYFACNFSQTNIANVVTPGNVGGEGITGVNYSINQIVVEPIRRRYSCNLVGVAWLQNCNDQSAYPAWNDTYGAPLIWTQGRRGMEPQLNGLIPNFDSYTSTYYYAPSQDIGIPNALYTDNGNAGPSGGDPGYNKWQKTVIWSSTDGNLYTHTGNPNVEYDGTNPVSWPLPSGVEIQLRDANTNETVLTWPENPLFTPSFAQAYPGSQGESTSTIIPINYTPTTQSQNSNMSSSTSTSTSTTSSNAGNGDTSSTTPLPSSSYSVVSQCASPMSAYLVFSPNGSWGDGDNGNGGYYGVTGLSDGKLTLTEFTTEMPSNLFTFKLSANTTSAWGNNAVTFTIQDPSTGLYLGGTSSSGFKWFSSQSDNTVFSTSLAYSGNGFGMNMGWDSTTLNVTWFSSTGSAPNGTTNQWTYWINATPSN